MNRYLSTQYPDVELFTEKWLLDNTGEDVEKKPTLF